MASPSRVAPLESRSRGAVQRDERLRHPRLEPRSRILPEHVAPLGMRGRRVLGRERYLGGGSASLAEINVVAQRTLDVEVDLRAVGVRREGAEDVARPRGLDGSPDPGGLVGRLDLGIGWMDDQVAAGAGIGQRAERRRPDPSRPGSGGIRSGPLRRGPACAPARFRTPRTPRWPSSPRPSRPPGSDRAWDRRTDPSLRACRRAPAGRRRLPRRSGRP